MVKRTLTTLQILQFLLGSTFAAIHLFISYTVPVSVAYKFAEKVAPQANATISSAITSATNSAAEALPTASGAAVAFLRKLIYRAAGDEGLAENIPVPGSPIPLHQQQHVVAGHPDHHNPVQNFFRHHDTVDRVVYRTEYQTVPCIDNSGQAFAVYLNLIYLAPLTILFMRFFFKSYLRRTSPNAKHQTKHTAISKATRDASHGVEREIESLGKAAEDGFSTAVKKSRDALRGRKINANGGVKDERHGSLSPANKKFVDNVNKKVNQRLQELDEGAEATTKKAKEIAKDIVGKTEETKEKVEEQYQHGKESAKQESQKANENVKEEGKKENGNVKEEQPGSRPGTPGTPQSKKAKQRANRKAREQSEKGDGKSEDDATKLTDEAVQKPEKEPEPKDLKNTLDKGEGKGLF